MGKAVVTWRSVADLWMIVGEIAMWPLPAIQGWGLRPVPAAMDETEACNPEITFDVAEHALGRFKPHSWND